MPLKNCIARIIALTLIGAANLAVQTVRAQDITAPVSRGAGDPTDSITVTGDITPDDGAIPTPNPTDEPVIEIRNGGEAAGITVNSGQTIDINVASPTSATIHIQSGGILSGTLLNQGNINDGVLIEGTNAVTGNVYRSTGSATLLGAFTVSGASVTSTSSGDHTIFIGDGTSVEAIAIGSGATIGNTATNRDAIHLESYGSLGTSASGTAIDVEGTLETTNGGNSVTVSSHATLTGSLENTGTITGQIDVTGLHTSSVRTIRNTGQISGGITVRDAGEITSTGDHTIYTGNNGVTDKIVIEDGGEISNSSASGSAIYVDNGGDLGLSSASDDIVVDIDGTLGSDNGKAILVADTGEIVGSIDNDGIINGGIEISGTHTSSTVTFNNVGTFNGGLTVKDGGTVTSASGSAGSHTVLTGNTGSTDMILVEAGGTITNSSTTVSNTIHVANGGTVGAGLGSTAIGVAGTLSSNGTDDAIHVADGGTIEGTINNTGTITGGIDIDGDHDASGNAYTGTGSLTGGYNILGSGSTASSGENTILIGNTGSIDQISVADGGELENTAATRNAIRVENRGTLGNGAGSTALIVAGTVSADGGDPAISVVGGGDIEGTIQIASSGTITGDIQIAGEQTATGRALDNAGDLDGGFTIQGATGVVTSSGNHTIYTGGTGSSIDKVTVSADSQLTNTSASSDTIHIASGGTLGSGAGAVAIDVAGTVSRSGTGSAVNIVSGATLQGTVTNSGTITGGIDIGGSHSASGIGYNGTGALTGGFNVTGTSTSMGNHTLNIGSSGSVDQISVGSSGAISNTATGFSAISVESGGSVGNGEASTAISVSGEVSGSGADPAISIADGGSVSGTIDINSTGTITGTIRMAGSQSASGRALDNLGELDGYFAVQSSGDVTSTGDHTLYTGAGGSIDRITVATSGEVTNTATGRSAIFVEGTNGFIGASTGTTAIDVQGTVSASEGDAAIVIGTDGTIRGQIVNGNNITGGISVAGDHTSSIRAFSNTGTLTGGYTVASGGSTTSSGNHTLYTGNSGTTDIITVAGTLSNTDNSSSAIFVDNAGTLGTAVDENAVEITGTVSASDDDAAIEIDTGGTLTGIIDNDGTITNGIVNGGTITGEIDNSGSITGGISNDTTFTGDINNSGTISGGISSSGTLTGRVTNNHATGITGGISISGTHTSSGRTLSNIGNLDGGYTVQTGGTATSTGDHTLYTGTASGNTDLITVEATGQLTNTDSGSNAIHVASAGTLGALATANAIDNAGTISSTNGGAAIGVASGGNLTGIINNSGTITGGVSNSGTITGGIDNSATINGGITNNSAFTGDINNTGTINNGITVSSTGTLTGIISNTGSATISGGVNVAGTHSSSGRTFTNTGTVAGTYSISGTVTSDDDHSVYIGSSGNIERIDITGTGTLSNTDTDTGAAAKSALYIAGDGSLGITADATALNINSGGELSSDNGSAITVADDGVITGEIDNDGTITNGIEISGSHSSSGMVLNNTGALTGGYNIGVGGSATSTGDHTIYTGNTGNTDSVSIATNAQLTNTGSGFSTVFVDTGGTMGVLAGTTIDNDGTLSASGGDTAIEVAGSGTLQGTILNDNTITGGIEIAGSHTASGRALENNSSMNSGYTVLSGGTSSSTGAHTLYTGSGGITGTITVGGQLTNTGTNFSAIFVDSGGLLGGVTVSVDVTGILSSSGGGAAISVANNGTMGAVRNTGDIIGGVEITGSQGSSIKTFDNTGTFAGSYTVSGGSVSSSGDHTIYTGADGSTEKITVETGGRITNGNNGSSAIYVDADGDLGTAAGSAAIETQGTGEISSDNGTAIVVADDGTITGSISNAGTITGGVSIVGLNTSSIKTFNNTGSITGGYTVSGTVSSSGDHTVFTSGMDASTDIVTVTSTGSVSNSGTGFDAIHVAGSGSIGTSATANAIENEGTVSATGTDAAIGIGTGGSITGIIDNTGTLTGGIDNAGTMTGRVDNTGTITGGINISGTHSSSGRSVDNTSSLTGGVSVSGTLSSSGGHTVFTGTGTGRTDSITVATGGQIENTHAGSSAIFVDANAIVGTNVGTAAIGTVGTGSISSTGGGAAIAVAGSGDLTGRIDNAGTITGDVSIAGAHSSSGRTLNNTGNLAGSYTVTGSGTATSTGGHTLYTGGTGSNTDKITVASSGQLTNTATGMNAIFVDASGDLGTAATVNAIENAGTISATGSDAAIRVNTGGTITGIIDNSDTITGGIDSSGAITGSIDNSGTISGGIDLSNLTSTTRGLENTGTLTGGFTVKGGSGNTVTSSGGHTVYTGTSSGSTDKITVEAQGTLSNTHAGSSAIFVDEDSTLGSSATNAAIETQVAGMNVGTISSTGGGAAITVVLDGTLTGRIDNAGTITGDVDIAGLQASSGRTFNNTGQADGYNVLGNGETRSDGDHTIFISGSMGDITVAENGVLRNTGTGFNAIHVDGSGTLGTVGSTVISNAGIISATGTDAAIVVAASGTLEGTINNSNMITGTIDVAGSHTATGKALDNTGTMNSGYTVSGSVTSSGDHTIYTGDGGVMGTVTVNSGAQITSTSTDDSAIYVDGNGLMGGAEAAVEIFSTGMVSSTSGPAIAIASTGILGRINNDGTITGGIEVTGTHTSGGITFNNVGILNGGYTVKDGGFASSNGGHTLYTGDTGRTGQIIVEEGGTVSNTATGRSAIYVNEGGILGDTVDPSVTAIDVSGTVSSAGGDLAIDVADGGTISGSINYTSTGQINGGIAISGNHTSSVKTFNNTGTLTGAYTVADGGQATSSGDHTIYTGADGSTDKVTVASGGTITNTGAGFSAIFVDDDGSLGSTANATAIDVSGTLSATATGSAIGVAEDGTLTGRIDNTGEITQGISIAGTHTSSSKSLNNTNDLSGGYTVQATGTVTSTGDHTLFTGADGTTDSITVADQGTLTNTATDSSAIFVGAQGNIGDTTDPSLTVINIQGSVSSENGGSAIEVGLGGTVTGTIANTSTGEISDGIAIDGDHTSSVRTFSNLGTLTGGYNVGTTGHATSTGGHTVYTGASGTTDLVSVAASGRITNTSSGVDDDAIFVDNDGILGTTDADASAINVAGTIDSENGSSIAVVGTGQLRGAIENTGNIEAGIVISGTHSSSIRALNNTGLVLGGYTVQSGGTASSDGDHTIYTGTATGSIDQVAVASGGTLGNTATSRNAIFVDNGSLLGTVAQSDIAVDVDGTISSSGNDAAIVVGTGGVILGSIDNEGSIDGGIRIGGTHSSSIVSFNNSGTLRGGYTVVSGGVATSTQHHTVLTAAGGVTDKITVNTGGQLTNTGSGSNAIHVAGGGTLGVDAGLTAVDVSGTVSSDGGDPAINIAEFGTVTGSIDVTSNGSVTNGIRIAGNVSAAGDTINITSGGSVGNNPARDTIEITSTGSLSSTVINGNAINVDGGTLAGAIYNAGDVTGNIFINGTQNLSNSVYRGEGRISDQATLTGAFTVGSGGNVSSSGNHTVNTSEYATTSKILVENGGTLTNGNANFNTIFVDELGQLGLAENETSIDINGALSSTGTDVIAIDGTALGRFLIGPDGQISNGNIHIASGGRYTGSIDVRGTVSDGVLINGSHSASQDDAITVSGQLGADAGVNTVDIQPTGTLAATNGHSAINIDDGGTITGIVRNDGIVTGGIDVAGTHTSSSKTFNNIGNLSGGYNVLSGGLATSTGDHTLYTGNSGITDSITVAAVGEVSSTGTGTNAIYVDSGGTLGSGAGNTAISVAGSVTADGDDSAIAVASGGNIVGSIQSTGVITGGVTVQGRHSSSGKALNNSGSLTGGYNVEGTATSSGDHTIYTGTTGMTDKVAVTSLGEITNTGSGTSAIYIDDGGTLGSDAGSTSVDNAGTISTSGSGAAIKSVAGGTILGSIASSGSISGGIEISGMHTSSGKTFNNTGLLSGGYTIKSDGLATSSGDHTLYTGSQGSDNGNTDRITVEDSGEITNTGTGFSAIYVASGGILGSSAGQTAIDIAGAVTASGDDTAIEVVSGGTITGTIANSGNITGGIEVTGTHSASGRTFDNTGLLDGGYTVENGGRVTSTGSHTLFTGNNGVTDKVTVVSGGQLSNSGSGFSAVYIGSGGRLGSTEGSTAIEVAGLVFADGGDAAIDVANGGTLRGTISNTGNITGGIDVSGIHSASGKGYDGTGRLTGGYNVRNDGVASSSGDHTVFTGSEGNTDRVTVDTGGELSNSGAGTNAIFVGSGGTLGTDEATIAVDVAGLLLSDGDDAALAVASGGTLTGVVYNSGEITGGIDITGTHSASGRAYFGMGELTGGYNVLNNGSVTSSDDHTIYTGSAGTTDQVTVAAGSSLTNTGTDVSAIYVDSGGSLGAAASANAIDVAGTVSADGGDAAIGVATGGRITGRIRNTGSITGGVEVSGIHTSSLKTFDNTGTLSGGYSVLDNGHATSTDDHTVFTGSSGTTDSIAVAEDGRLTNTGTDTSAIYVADEGNLGSGAGVTAIDVAGLVSADAGDIAIDVVDGGTLTGSISSTGTITGGIRIAGTHTASTRALNNTGSLTGGYSVAGDGLAASTADHTLYTGDGGSTDQVAVASGSSITNTGTSFSAIYVDDGGVLGGGDDAIDVEGTISSTNGKAITVAEGGELSGAINNQGTITNGIEIAGLHSSATRAYNGLGTLTGGYTVATGGRVDAPNDHSVYIGDGGTVDFITVEIDGELANTCSDRSAIYVDNGGLLGALANAVAIDIAGAVSSSDGIAIDVAASGRILGILQNTGTITNGISISGEHTSSGRTFTNAGTLTGGYTIASGGTVTSTGGHTLYTGTVNGNSGSTDQIVIAAGGEVTNTGTGTNAIHIDDAGTVGSTADQVAIEVAGSVSSSGDDAAIQVATGGTVIGSIENTNTITGGIEVAGTHTSSGKTFDNTGTLAGGYTIANGGLVTSSGDHTLYTASLGGRTGTTDRITVAAGGHLTNTGTGFSAIHLASGGQIGSDAGSTAIDIAGTVSSTGADAAINIASGGRLTGTAVNTGDIVGGIVISGIHTSSGRTFDNRGDLTGGYRVDDGGIATSTAVHTIFTGDGGDTDQVSVVSGGQITNTGTGTSAIYVGSGGNLGSTAGAVAVDVAGSVSADGGDIALDVAGGGTLTGEVAITGSVAGGIEVSGIHTSSGFSLRNTGTLAGGYTVQANGLATSTGDHTVYTGTAGSTDKVTVAATGRITNTGSGGSSIYVDTGGTLGISPADTAVEIAGTVSADEGDVAIEVASGGNLVGILDNSGVTTDGIRVSGTHSSGGRTFSNTGSLSDGYTVADGGRVTSTGGHTIYTGATGTTDKLTVATGGEINNANTGSSAVYVDDQGSLGNDAGEVAIDVEGILSGGGDAAVQIAEGGTITGTVRAADGGVINDRITVSGVLTASGDTVYIGSGGSLGSDVSGNAIEVTSTGVLSSTGINGRAVHIDGGRITGTIFNQGEVTGEIVINGTQDTDGAAYHGLGTSSDEAILSSAFRVGTTATVSSATDHTVFTDNHATTRQIIVEDGGTLTNTHSGSSTVYVAEEGTLGGVETDTAILVDGTLSSTGPDAVTIAGEASGRLLVSATGEISDGNINIASGASYTGTIDVQGTVADSVLVSGTHSATLDDAIRVTGILGSDDSANVIQVGGTGSISATGDHLAINVAVGGVLTGIINNEGAITGGIEIWGTHISSGKTYTGSGTLGGGYTVMDGGIATSTGDHTLYTGSGVTTNMVTVQEGATINNTGTGSSAVYVDNGGTLGTSASGIAIDIDGGMSANGGDAAIVVANGGTILGIIDNTGEITGGVMVSGLHTSSGRTLNNSGRIFGGYTVATGGRATSSGDHTVYTADGGYTDKVTVATGGQLTNTGDGFNAIYIASNGSAGSAPGVVAIEVAGSVTADGGDAAIAIADDGSVLGIIDNSGTITGIDVTGLHTSSGKTFRNTGNLTGGYTIRDSGAATSSGDHTLYTGDGGNTDMIAVDAGGQVTNTGSGSSAIFVADGGRLGAAANASAVVIAGAISASDSAAIGVGSGGTITGRIDNSGTIDGIEIAGTHSSSTKTFNNTGTLTGSYTITDGGLVTSSGDHTIYTASGGETNRVTVLEGAQLTNTGTGTNAIFVGDGGLLGDRADGIAIDVQGTVSADGGDAAIKVATGGTLRGTLSNSGSILGGIEVSGSQTHTASGRTFSNTGNLAGGYTVLGDGLATSTDDHTIFTGNGGITDKVTIETGGRLTNSDNGSNTIYIADGGTLGSSEGTTAIDVAGTVSSTGDDAAVVVANGGTVLGTIDNSGTITGGLEVAGVHRSSGRTFNNTSTLSGGYTVLDEGSVTSNGGHTIFTGSTGVTDRVSVASGGSLTNTGIDTSAIFIESTGVLGTTAGETAISVDGTLSATGGGKAVSVSSSSTLRGAINNSGTITGGVEISGTHTSSTRTLTNTGNLTGGYTVTSGGVATSTADHTLYTGDNGYTDRITVDEGGTLSSSGSDARAVYVDSGGTLGSAAGVTAVNVVGILSASDAKAIHVASGGEITGIVANTGTITGGIEVAGVHTSSGRTFNNTSSLSGGYTVAGSGLATSSGGHTLFTGSGGMTDKITVAADGQLTNTGEGYSAIHVAHGGDLGTAADVVAVEVAGTVSADGDDAAIEIENGGELLGFIDSTGVISGGVDIFGLHTSSYRALNNSGNLTGGYNVLGTGIATSSGNHTVYTGENGVTDNVTVAVASQLTNTSSGHSAIYVDAGGTLGSTVTGMAVNIAGTVSADDGDLAIAVAGGGAVVGEIRNSGTLSGGVGIAGSQTTQGKALNNTGNLTGGFTVQSGGNIVITGDHGIYTGDTGDTDIIRVDEGGQINHSGEGTGAIYVDSGGSVGTTDDVNAIEVAGTVSSSDGSAIGVADNGEIIGIIENTGAISGGIDVAGTHRSSGKTFNNTGSLSGGYNVAHGGLTTSNGDHTIFIGDGGAIDQVSVSSGGQLTNTGTERNTIYVDAGGTLGGIEVAVDVAGELSADGADLAINVISGGTINGSIRNTGTITGGIEISGTHTSAGRTFDNTGTLTGGYTVQDGGLATSSADYTIYTGDEGVTEKLTVAEGGQITNTCCDKSVVYVDDGGTLGTGAGVTAIDVDGLISSMFSKGIGVASGGTILGDIDNTGSIVGGIDIAGTHTASGKTFNNTGSLTGGYTVADGGIVTSTGDHTVYTGHSGDEEATIDSITVAADGQLTNTAVGGNAIKVDSGGILGTTADATAIDIAGTVSADGGDAAIDVSAGGTLTGQITSSGTITGGINNSGVHSTSGNAFNNTGNLTGGYIVASGGTTTSTGSHTIFTGNSGATDKVTVAAGAQLTNTGDDSSVIFVDAGGSLGSTPDATAIDVSGTLSADGGDAAIAVARAGTITGSIDNSATISGGIDIAGTHTASGKTLNNTGSLTGGYTVQDDGLATSSGDHTIYTGGSGTIDKVTVAHGGSITNTDAGSSAIYVDDGGSLGFGF